MFGKRIYLGSAIVFILSMRALLNIIKLFFVLAIAGGLAWKFYETEIREFLHLPEAVVESDETGETEKRSRREKIVRTDDNTNETDQNDEEVAKPEQPETDDKEALLQQIVMERYPDITRVPFSEKYPDITTLPESAFPARVKAVKMINFKLTRAGKVIAASAVKAGGSVWPRRFVDGDQLEVSSLANGEMTTSLAQSETDFQQVAESNYEKSMEDAIARIEEMREADKSELRSNSYLFRQLEKEKKAWHDAEDENFQPVKESLAAVLGDRPYKPVAFYWNGKDRIDEGGYTGIYYVAIVLIEGTDKGFGPYHWRAKCFLQVGEVVGWVGLPEEEKEHDANS